MHAVFTIAWRYKIKIDKKDQHRTGKSVRILYAKMCSCKCGKSSLVNENLDINGIILMSLDNSQ